MKSDLNDNEFYEYIDKLKEIYEKKPKTTIKETKDLVKRLSKTKNELIKDEHKETFYMIMLIIGIALLGLVNIQMIPLYLGGLVFFISGLLIGIHVRGFGIIFLFSHGMTGFILMLSSIIGGIFSSPIMTDAPIYIYIYIGIIAAAVFIAIIITILFNLSDELSKRRYFKLIPIIIFGIAIIVALILAKIVEFKYGINISGY